MNTSVTLTAIGSMLVLAEGLVRHRITLADKLFEQEIRLAQTTTTESCGKTLFRLVLPPPGSSKRPVVVMAGKVVAAGEESLYRIVRNPAGIAVLELTDVGERPAVRILREYNTSSTACEWPQDAVQTHRQ